MKLYVVTRQDLSQGQQIAQSCHAVAEYSLSEEAKARQWHQESNTIICLSVANEYELHCEYDTCLANGFEPVPFMEPDFFDEWTAFAVVMDGTQSWVFGGITLAGYSSGSLLKEAAKREAARNFANNLTTNNIER